MGLGIFIAETLLQRTGAVLEFSNSPNGGAVVRVTWPMRTLVAPVGTVPPLRKLEESTV